MEPASPPAQQRVQDSIDALKRRLALPYEVTAEPVETHPLLAAVVPVRGHEQTFRLSFEADFVDELSDEQLDAVVAHELGHVWIFTHHPFLQTEQLANEIATRVVSRHVLDAVYAKVWARVGDRQVRAGTASPTR